mmetsp:Transcript_3201/g.5986  ORF Transcript_3201/g.5986 Transcript_3201/m.5986 type:complete len:133 (-) Transcript_3201:612-1010(-)
MLAFVRRKCLMYHHLFQHQRSPAWATRGTMVRKDNGFLSCDITESCVSVSTSQFLTFLIQANIGIVGRHISKKEVGSTTGMRPSRNPACWDAACFLLLVVVLLTACCVAMKEKNRRGGKKGDRPRGHQGNNK